MSNAVWDLSNVFNISIIPLDLNGPAGYSFFVIFFGCIAFYSHQLAFFLAVPPWISTLSPSNPALLSKFPI